MNVLSSCRLAIGSIVVGLLVLEVVACSSSGGNGAGSSGSSGSPESGTSDTPSGDAASSSGDGGTFQEPTCTPTNPPVWKYVQPSLPDMTQPAVAPPAGYVGGFHGIAYGNGVFVAMGDGVRVDHLTWATTTDGDTWTVHTQSVGAGTAYTTQSDLVYFGGHFMTLGTKDGNAYAYTSTDGLTWTETKMGPGGPGESIAFGGTTWVTAGANNAMWTSTDLTTWKTGGVPQAGAFGYNNIVFGAGRFVTGINGGGPVFTSSDGMKWDPVSGVESPGGSHLTFGRNLFVATNNNGWFTSTDGVTFSPIPNPPDLKPPVLIGGTGFFVGNQIVWPGSRLDGSNVVATFWSTLDEKTFTSFGDFPAGKVGGIRNAMAYGRCKYILTSTTAGATPTPYAFVADGAPAP